jgi:hypothetical protein
MCGSKSMHTLSLAVDVARHMIKFMWRAR